MATWRGNVTFNYDPAGPEIIAKAAAIPAQPSDPLAAEVGGNRYVWLVNNDFNKLASTT